MKEIVEELAQHKVYADLCGFSNTRFAHEDAVAKLLHLMLTGSITDIRHSSISKTYKDQKNIDSKNAAVEKTKKSLNFLVAGFSKTQSPAFKKFAVITVPFLVSELLERYNLSKFKTEFAKAYLDFEYERLKNAELPEDKQDRELAAYTDAARADGLQHLRYRHELLRERIVRSIPELELKDPIRGFSEEQRRAIFWRDKHICQSCRGKCDEADFHIDHVKAHANGGPTKISNAQLLCADCNLKKGSK